MITSISPQRFVLLLLFLALCAVFFELGRMDVVTDNEGQRAAPPAEMLRSGDYLVPTLNGRTYLAKPPLLYWVIASLYAATGWIDEWTARIPTALCGVALILSIYLAFRRGLGEPAARLAALGFLAAPYFMERARIAELDVPLVLATFWTVWASYSAWRAESTASRYGLALLGGLALAAAAMLKGPVPYLFLGAAFLAFLLAHGRMPDGLLARGARWTALAFAIGTGAWAITMLGLLFGKLWSIPFPVALCLYLLVWLVLAVRNAGPILKRALPALLVTLVGGTGLVAPYAVAVVNRLGWERVDQLLNSEVVERTHTATQINSGSPFYYLLIFPFMIVPLGLLVPLIFNRKLWEQESPVYRFAILMPLLSIGLFSLIAGKEYEYILPCLPIMLGALGLATARALAGDLTGWTGAWYRGWARATGAFLPVGAVALVIYAAITYGIPMLLAECILIAAVALALCLTPWARRSVEAPARFAIVVVLLTVGALTIRSFHYQGQKSIKTLAQQCGALVAAGYTVESSKIFPAFTFYAAHPIKEVLDPEAVYARLHQAQPPYFYLTLDRFYAQFAGEGGRDAPAYAGPRFGSKKMVLLGNMAPEPLLGAEAPAR